MFQNKYSQRRGIRDIYTKSPTDLWWKDEGCPCDVNSYFLPISVIWMAIRSTDPGCWKPWGVQVDTNKVSMSVSIVPLAWICITLDLFEKLFFKTKSKPSFLVNCKWLYLWVIWVKNITCTAVKRALSQSLSCAQNYFQINITI